MKLFRYRLAVFSIISGICIAFIMFYYIAETEYLRQRQEERNIASDMQTLYIRDVGEVNTDRLGKLLEYKPDGGYVFLRGMDVYINSSRTYNNSVVISCGEIPEEVYRLSAGRYPSEEEYEKNEPVVLAGFYFRNDVEREEGIDYIEIEGERYKVIGYLNDASAGIVMPNTAVQPNLKERMERQVGVSLMLSLMPLDEGNSGLYDECMEVLTQSRLEAYAGSEFFVPTGERTETFLNYSKIILIFCILFLCFVMEFWIRIRLKEFAIKRAIGVPVARIWIESWLQILVCFIIGGLIALPIIILLEFTQKMYLMEILGIILGIAAPSALFLLACSLLFSLIPAVLLVRCRPVSLLMADRG